MAADIGKHFTVQEIYQFTKNRGIQQDKEFYIVPRIYHDTSKAQREKNLLTSKNKQILQQYNQKQTKSKLKFSKLDIDKSNFLYNQLKEASKIPGPGQYSKTQKWEQEKQDINKNLQVQAQENKKNITKFKNQSKETYFAQLMIQQIKNKYPSPAAYKQDYSSINYAVKEFSKKHKEKKVRSLSPQTRDLYLNDVFFASSQIPGPGSYNPHKPLQLKKVTVNNKDQQYWIKKHMAQSADSKKSERLPCVWTYTPRQNNFQTFDTMKPQQNLQGKKNSISPNNFPNFGFGQAQRFSLKKKIDPITKIGHYNLNTQWVQQKSPKSKISNKHNFRNIFDIQTKGIEKSIYYS